MFFAYIVLRAFASTLPVDQRLHLWGGVFKRFFPWVWMSVLVLPITGYWLIFKHFQGFGSSPVYVHIMHLLGLVMIVLFVVMYHGPYRVFKSRLAAANQAEAGAAMNKIRLTVLVNLLLGLLLLAVVSAGRYGVFS